MSDIMPGWCAELHPPLEPHFSVLQLGNKRTKGTPWTSDYQGRVARFDVIDLNGLDGAWPLDLSQQLDLDQYDLVTNFGTTEHVVAQKPCWRNIHSAIKIGGWLISSTPIPGYWTGHGRYYPTQEFFEQFALANAYDIEDIHHGRGFRLNVRMRKRQGWSEAYIHPSDETMFVNETGRHVGISTI